MIKKCIGCGEILQTTNSDEVGYVKESVYNKSEYCERCFKITHYGETSVIDKKVDIDAFIEKINKENKPVLYLADITTLSKLTLEPLKKIKTKKYLVLTKRDLLPKSIRSTKVVKWIQNFFDETFDIIISSSTKKMNIDLLYDKLTSDNIKEIYIVGFTNSGKSTLVNALLNSKGMKSIVTSSILPNTTTEMVKIKLSDELTIIDTPGFTSERLVMNYIDMNEYKRKLPKKEIHPKIYHLYSGDALIIDNFMRVENRSNNTLNLIFYLKNELEYKKCKLIRNMDLFNLDKLYVKTNGNEDIVIEGFGFIKVMDASELVLYVVNKKIVSKRAKLV